jgi:DNA replication and repair protein RecF
VRIETLSSTYFRNLAFDCISFSPGVNLFIGDNGQGKTNILEAVYLFKFGRSFRARRDSEMIRFGESFCRVEVTSKSERGEEDEYVLVMERGGGKQVKLSGKPVARYSELVGSYPCVLFGPQDIELINGSPVERRRFIDMAGSMTDRVHLDVLRDYRRILQQRNAALKRGKGAKEWKIWDEELIKKGCALSEKRGGVVDEIEKHVKRYDRTLKEPFKFRLRYRIDHLDTSAAVQNAEEAFSMKLAAVENEEMRRGVTMVGPHRDDVVMLLENKELKRYGSQGQKRLLSVILKLAEMSYLEKQLNERCILLLDDVFSEFDPSITFELKKILGDDRQVFVTSPVPLDWKETRSSEIFYVINGRVSL